VLREKHMGEHLSHETQISIQSTNGQTAHLRGMLANTEGAVRALQDAALNCREQQSRGRDRASAAMAKLLALERHDHACGHQKGYENLDLDFQSQVQRQEQPAHVSREPVETLLSASTATEPTRRIR
jgi:hypothetical protein